MVKTTQFHAQETAVFWFEEDPQEFDFLDDESATSAISKHMMIIRRPVLRKEVKMCIQSHSSLSHPRAGN